MGLAYIAAVLERKGHDVSILDMPALRMNLENLKKFGSANEVDIYGISCTLFSLREGIKCARIIKNVRPKAKVILGGYCTMFSPDTILTKAPFFDFIVRGEGEYTMLELCDALEEKEKIHHVAGLSFKEDGEIFHNPDRPPINNLDELPFPARHLLPNGRYKLHPPFGIYNPITTMEASRGCPYNCIFCCFSHAYRCRSVNRIVEEIEHVINEYKIKEIYFVDPTFTLDEPRIVQMCDEVIERGLKFAWTCQTRPDLVSKPLLNKMKEAGCYLISYGIESGSQEILDKLKKDTREEQIEKAITWTREARIRSSAYLIIGSPGETVESVKKTLGLMSQIEPDYVSYSGISILPGTKVYRDTIQNISPKNDWYENFLFSDKTSEWPIYATPAFPRAEISKWIEQGLKEFYLNPKYWIRRLLDLKSISDAKNLVRGITLLASDHTLLKRDIIRW